MGGKSGGAAGQTYDYYGTLAGGLCVGPVSEVVSIILNGQEAWPRGTPWILAASILPGVMYVFDAQTWTCTTAHVASLTNAPGSGLEGWTEYTFKYHGSPEDDFSLSASDGTFQGTLRLYWGTAAQTVDFYLQAANNDGGIKGHVGAGDQHPDYKGVCYCVLIDFLLGQEIQSGPNVEIVLRRPANQTLVTGNAALITDGQANLAAVLCEVLTDPNLLGLPTTMIDTTSFQAVANYLYANTANYDASVLIDSAETLRSFLDKIVQMIDGFIRFNPTTQLIELGVYEHGVTPATYMTDAPATLTVDMLTKIPKFEASSWSATFSRATIRYNSRQLAYQQTSVYADDPRSFFVLGVTRDQPMDRPYISREGQALFHGREALRVIGHAQMTGELEVRREFGRTVRAGDFVFVDVDLEPGGSSVFQYFRVTQRKIPPTGPITLELFADNTLQPVPYSTPYPALPGAAAVVAPLTSLRVLQVPDTLSGEHNAITVLAVRPDNLIAGCQLYFDTSRVVGTLVSLAADATGLIGILTFSAATTFEVGDPIDVGGATNGTYVDSSGVTHNAFNVSLATVTYATGTVVKYALNGAVAANLVATGTIVVADYFTTFSNLGAIPNFAAKATLNTALTTAAASLDVLVDTTQADADYFTNQFTANDAAGDVMLAIIVSVVASGGDAGQVTETNGFGVFEICSISSQTLVSAGRYTVNVLRGRQGTNATAFTTANTEVWLIPRANVVYFVSGAFDVIRANRVLNTVPQYAQFRFTPFTFANALPLSSATNHQFRFPLKSAQAPALTLTTPTGTTITNSGTLPYRAEFAGTWTDGLNNIVRVQILVEAPGESSARVIKDWHVAQTGSYAFDQWITFDKPGSHTVQLICTDANGLATEVDILANMSGVAKCAFPDLVDCQGNLVSDASGNYTKTTLSALGAPASGLGASSAVGWTVAPAQFFPFGPWSFNCSTPGSTIYFASSGIVFENAKLQKADAYSGAYEAYFNVFSPGFCPFHILIDPATIALSGQNVSAVVSATYWIVAYATASGYANSDPVKWTIPLFI